MKHNNNLWRRITVVSCEWKWKRALVLKFKLWAPNITYCLPRRNLQELKPRNECGPNVANKMSSRSKRKSKSSKRGKRHQSAPKKVEVDYSPPKAFIILLVALALVSFVLGCITRLYLISNFQLGKLGKNFTTSIMTNSDNQGSEISLMTGIMPVKHLPTPKLASGRKAPISTYSSKIFHTANLAVASSNTVHLDVTLSSHLRTMSNKGASAAAIDEIYFNVDQSSNINMKNQWPWK